jgi:predicted PurR-regulated permease PerM
LSNLTHKQDEFSSESRISYQDSKVGVQYQQPKKEGSIVRLGQWIGLIVFVISLYILWQIRQVLLLIFAAVVLATALNRLVRLFQRFRIQRGIAIALSIGLLITLLVGFFVVIVPPFIEQLQELVDLVPTGLENLRSWANWLQNLFPEQVLQDIRGLKGFTQQLQSTASRLFGNFLTLFSNSLGIVLNFLLVLVLTIMLLSDPARYRQGLILLIPSFYRQRVNEILQQCEVALGGWAAGILFNMTVITVLSGIGLWILQVPLALANAILAGVLTFIPNLGPTLSVIPPMALALLDAPWKAGAVLVLYIAIQQIESNILTPLVMEKQVSLAPALTLASQIIFASFFGFLGLFLALPLMVVTQVWIKEILVKDVLNKWE